MNFSFFFGVFFFGVFTVFVGMFVFFINRFHYMISLLCLEFMILGIFLCSVGLFFCGFKGFVVFFILSFASCEAAVGLSLLVCLIRSHGSDFFKVVSLYEC